MIRKLWFVRNRHRLFIVLNFTISLTILIYTILNLFVFTKIEKYMLLILPAISLLLCFLFYNKYKKIYKRKSIQILDNEIKAKKIEILQQNFIGYNFILVLLLYFIQNDILNFHKGLKGSYIIFEILCLVALFVFTLHQNKQSKKLK